MKALDHAAFALHSLGSGGARTMLVAAAMGLGCTFVVVLAWIGDSGRAYVDARFQALGANLVLVLPGRAATRGGGMPSPLGETTRELTLDDASALSRLDGVLRAAPLVAGGATVSRGAREREATVLGTTAEFAAVRRLEVARGAFLPEGDPRRSVARCVLGATVARELFGASSAVGNTVRLQDRTFRVVGVLAAAGVSLGSDLDEAVFIPVASAMELFDTEALFRVLLEARDLDASTAIVAAAERTMQARHDGELDVTVVTQDAVRKAFDSVLATITTAITGIAAVSLFVAGVLVLDVMTVAVSQRRAEIGLLCALGANRGTVRAMFVLEASALVLLGAASGVVVAEACCRVAARLVPGMRDGAPPWAAAASLATALVMGVAFGVRPALRASRLDPSAALTRR